MNGYGVTLSKCNHLLIALGQTSMMKFSTIFFVRIAVRMYVIILFTQFPVYSRRVLR